jgi:hypothetical protein
MVRLLLVVCLITPSLSLNTFFVKYACLDGVSKGTERGDSLDVCTLDSATGGSFKYAENLTKTNDVNGAAILSLDRVSYPATTDCSGPDSVSTEKYSASCDGNANAEYGAYTAALPTTAGAAGATLIKY